MKLRLFLAAASILAVAALVASPTEAVTTPSATASLVFKPASASPGQTVKGTGKVKNTSAASETITARLTGSGPCGVSVDQSKTVTLTAGKTYRQSMSFSAPPCPGSYNFNLAVTSGSQTLATAHGGFTVT
jgi:hypothetical protein